MKRSRKGRNEKNLKGKTVEQWRKGKGVKWMRKMEENETVRMTRRRKEQKMPV